MVQSHHQAAAANRLLLQAKIAIAERLERHYRDMQDIEFTVQQNKLYMLQTRNGKRTAAASLKIAVDMAREGLIDEKEAVRRVKKNNPDKPDLFVGFIAIDRHGRHGAWSTKAGFEYAIYKDGENKLVASGY